MCKSIIVAKYKEDVAWVDSIPHATKFIYNKDESNKNDAFINLPNIGRETQTYFYHIVNNYDNLSDINIFVQGNPIDHAPNFIQTLSKDSYKDFEFVSEFYQDENLHYMCQLVPEQLSMELFFDILLMLDKPPFVNYRFWGGAMFAVSRNRIHNHPKELYQKLLDMCISERKMPWVMERLWQHVFD